MNSTAYDTVNVISQCPPLELRRRQEEVKLFQKCVKWSKRLPDHNLTQAYNLWRSNYNIDGDERISWSGKLSTLSRAFIHGAEVGIEKVEPDRMRHWNKPPMQASKLPHSIKSPFEKWSEPTPDEILGSLDENAVVIFADGSCKPEPGLGGAGLVVQDPSFEHWLELEFPIKGITTTIGSEIEAVRQGLEHVNQNYIGVESRVVMLSDCKFVVNAILNKCNSETYNFPVAECQRLMKNLGENDVPEIYWIKGHSGIPGNERADAVAKRARFKAETEQPELYRRPDKSALFLNFHCLNPSFTKEWNRHWTNEGNEMEPHKYPKRFLCNLIDAQSFEKIVLHRLDVHERRCICRIITGKVGLNAFLFKIKQSYTPDCKWCKEEEETVEHFLMECPHYEGLREVWRASVKNLVPLIQFNTANLKLLVVGNKTWEPETRIQVVKQLSKFVVATGRKI
jgi:ribonuclease HI